MQARKCARKFVHTRKCHVSNSIYLGVLDLHIYYTYRATHPTPNLSTIFFLWPIPLLDPYQVSPRLLHCSEGKDESNSIKIAIVSDMGIYHILLNLSF